jgi:hypothetical protein
VSGAASRVWQAFRRSARARDALVAVGIGLACLLFMAGPLSPNAGMRNWTVPAIYNILQFGLPMVLAIRWADAAVAQGASPWRWYGGIAIAVPAAGVWLFGPALVPLLGGDPGWSTMMDVWLFGGVAIVLGMGTAVYAHWREGARVLARRHATEAERLERARQLQARRLLALQARVDPPLLFAALHAVRRLAAEPGDAAEGLLTETIALLRALLPAARATHSTLGRELALVQAQARVWAQALAQPVEGTDGPASPALPLLLADLQPDAADAEFSPLVLPELLRLLASLHPGPAWSLAARLERFAALPTIELHIEPLAAADAAAAHPPAPALESHRLQALVEQLRSVHGPQARIELRATPGAIGAWLHLPWTAAPAPPPEHQRS